MLLLVLYIALRQSVDKGSKDFFVIYAYFTATFSNVGPMSKYRAGKVN